MKKIVLLTFLVFVFMACSVFAQEPTICTTEYEINCATEPADITETTVFQDGSWIVQLQTTVYTNQPEGYNTFCYRVIDVQSQLGVKRYRILAAKNPLNQECLEGTGDQNPIIQYMTEPFMQLAELGWIYYDEQNPSDPSPFVQQGETSACMCYISAIENGIGYGFHEIVDEIDIEELLQSGEISRQPRIPPPAIPEFSTIGIIVAVLAVVAISFVLYRKRMAGKKSQLKSVFIILALLVISVGAIALIMMRDTNTNAYAVKEIKADGSVVEEVVTEDIPVMIISVESGDGKEYNTIVPIRNGAKFLVEGSSSP